MPEENSNHQVVSQRQPIRCFDGNAKPYEPFWTWRNEADSEEPELELYGYISEYSWWEDDVTPKKFRDDLNNFGGGGPITVRLNSYGGDVIAANLINTFIHDYPGRVTVQIDGVAASAATVVAVAGDLVKMQAGAYFMIHDPLVLFFLAALNIEDLTRLAESLQSVKDGILNVYESKTGLSRPRLSKMMTDETWMDAQKALNLGFADEIIEAGKKPLFVPENAAVVNALHHFKKVPENLMRSIQTAATSSAPLLSDDEKRQAQSLRERINTILKKE
jgi:ATP-dependent Clp protease, protease subunit